MGGYGGAQLGKDFSFQLDDLLLRVEDFALVDFQLGRGEALGVDQRLLALVVVGHQMEIGFGNLNVEAKDRIEFDLERSNAGALPLALLYGQNVLPRVVAEVAQLV